MRTFGELLRIYRRQSRDPLRGGFLTQERLGELLGHELGGAGYSGAAVSDWERNKSKINEDDRLVLVSIVSVLHRCGGLETLAEADDLLRAGNYRGLNRDEASRCFPESEPEAGDHVRSVPKSWVIARTTSLSLPSTDRRRQLILLEKVRNFWVKGVLEAALQGAKLINVDYQRQDELIAHPWSGVLTPPTLKAGRRPGRRTMDIYLESDRALLILGQPGAGKTTMLIALADDLIVEAEGDPSQPIPVILSLASWAESRQPIAEWAIEELTAKYQVPRRMGRTWLNRDSLLLLLDGFNEVNEGYRKACARAINRFRETHGLTGIVVCSRIDEYQAVGVPLRLGGAIALQPLSRDQIEHYLARTGSKMATLRTALEQEPAVRDMARSPLLLNIMTQVYSGGSEDPADKAASLPERIRSGTKRLNHLFAAYMDRMFHHRPFDSPCSPAQTKSWLSWLARKMVQHNETVFLIEQMQPSWLPTSRWRWLYLLFSWLTSGLTGGFIMWLFLLLLRRIVPWPDDLSAWAAAIFNLAPAYVTFLAIVSGNMILALLAGSIHGLYLERRHKLSGEGGDHQRPGWKPVAMVGFAVGLAAGAFLAPIGEPVLALGWGIAEAVLFMAVLRQAYGRSYRRDVRAVEALRWSWKSAAKGVIFGLLLVPVAEVIETVAFGWNGAWRTVATFGLGGLLLGGLRGARLEAKSSPNQGIWLSLRNALIAAPISGVPLGLLTWLLRDPASGWLTGLFMALIAALLFGGSNVAKHYLLRALLWFAKRLPWNLAQLLDNAVQLGLLRRVGGGYIFMHPLLQDYFLAL